MTRQRDLPSVIVSAGDHDRLMALAHSQASHQDPLGCLLLAKLARAAICEVDAIPEDAVCLDRFVTYRLAGRGHPVRRLLIHPDDRMWSPAELPVDTPLGLTLLGLSAGDRTVVVGSGQPGPPWVDVLAVEGGAASGIARRPAFGRRGPAAFVGGSGRMP